MSNIACISNKINVIEFDYNNIDDNPLKVLCSASPDGDQFTSLCWNHTNQVIAASNRVSRKIKLYQASNGTMLSSIPFNENEIITDNIVGVAFSNNSRYIAAGVGNKALVWDLKRRNLKYTFKHDSPVTVVTYFQDSKIICGDNSGVIKVWDMKTTEAIAQTDSSLFSPVQKIKICNKIPNHMICHRKDGTIQVYDLHDSCKMLRNMLISTANSNTDAYSSSGIVDFSLSPRNNKLLTTISSDGFISLVDTSMGGNGIKPQTYRPSALIPPNSLNGQPSCVACHENGFHFAVGTTVGVLYIFDWRNASDPVCQYSVSPGSALRNIEFQNHSAMKSANPTPVKVASTSSISSSTVDTFNPNHTNMHANIVHNNLPKPPKPLPISNMSNLDHTIPDDISEVSAITMDIQDHSIDIYSHAGISNNTNEILAKPLRNNDSISNPPIEIAKNITPHDASSVGGIRAEAVLVTKASEINIKRTEIESKTNFPSPLPKDFHSPTKHLDSTVIPSPSVMSAPNGETETKFQISASVTNTIGTSQGKHDVDRNRVHDEPPSVVMTTTEAPEEHNLSVVSNPSQIPRTQVEQVTHELLESSLNSVREAIRPVSQEILNESLDNLRYDIHKEIQVILREQTRQFSIARDENYQMMKEMYAQLQSVLQANETLRQENNELRYQINKNKYDID